MLFRPDRAGLCERVTVTACHQEEWNIRRAGGQCVGQQVQSGQGQQREGRYGTGRGSFNSNSGFTVHKSIAELIDNANNRHRV